MQLFLNMRSVKVLFITFFILLWHPNLYCAEYPKYEYRAVWLTTIENLDWPRMLAVSPASAERQRNELCLLLDSLKALNVNTVLLQTRVRGDVIYPSHIEPFSHVLTGVEGKNPGYDPLAFAIDECHKRGIQLHAWVVTMPLGKDEHIKRQGRLALSSKRKDLCTHYKGAWYMEPGNPATDDYIVALVREIVDNYNVDGIHLDYIRYPDRTKGYPDESLHRKYGRGKSVSSWRRSNITRLVRAVYSCVKELKPWVRVSCAPLGKHDDLTRYSSLGWNAYDAVFQDAQSWMRDGIMDILFPMLYFNGNNFYPFVRDWQESSNGRHIVPGIGVYRLQKQYGGWSPIEIERQLSTSRIAGTAGTAMFRTAHLVGNAGGLLTLYSKHYSRPSLVPPMEWASLPPAAPSGFKSVRTSSGVELQWQPSVAKEGMPPVRYNVYGALCDTVDITSIDNLLASSLDSLSYSWQCRTSHPMSVAVTAVNAFGIESAPVVVTFPGVSRMPVNELSLPEIPGWGCRIEVHDMYGRMLYRGRYSRRIGVRGLPSGCYMLHIYDRRGVPIEKVHFMR